MAVRTEEYTVSAKEIKPSALQCGGIQGEHNATELVFLFDKDFKEQLISLETTENKKVYYRFEAYTGSGIKKITVPQILYVRNSEISEANPLTVAYTLENWLTRDGGKVRVYLVISYINTDNSETLMDMYTYPAFLKLDAVPDGQISDEEEYESIPTFTASAKDSAIRAEAAAETAVEAREITESARFALENGEFIFLGGDASGTAQVDIGFTTDEAMSDESVNPVENRVIKEYVDAEIQKLTEYIDGSVSKLIGVGTAEEMEKSDCLLFFVVE